MLVVILLLAFRLPSLAQPAGGDQFLYSYVAERVLHGDVPYRDAFEQKPPGIFAIYAAMWTIWPRESVVAAADLAAAALTAALLVLLGRRMFGGAAGAGAASLFLLLSDPGIQRLSGLNHRSQCEVFIALAVTAAITSAWTSRGRTSRLALAGALLGVAFWLKYNAIAYVIPIAIAVDLAEGAPHVSRVRRLSIAALGALALFAAGLCYFLVTQAFSDLWHFTIGYNLAYSGETYHGLASAAAYVLTLPVQHAFVDGLWFLGGVGCLGLSLTSSVSGRARLLALAWVAATVLSIAINGARGLPQYFVQASPALALAAAGGLASIWRARISGAYGRVLSVGAAVFVLAGIWRVGIESTPLSRPRLFGLPQAVSNAAFDISYIRGRIDRPTYLERFRADVGKFSPASVERLAVRVQEISNDQDPILVFGFASGGVLVKSGRRSASRFFWSRPVVLEFERDRPGYGSAGLLQDLQREPPSIVALQKHDWGLAEDVPDSMDFFMNTAPLRAWLEAGYEPDYEDSLFSVWRRKH